MIALSESGSGTVRSGRAHRERSHESDMRTGSEESTGGAAQTHGLPRNVERCVLAAMTLWVIACAVTIEVVARTVSVWLLFVPGVCSVVAFYLINFARRRIKDKRSNAP